VGKWKMKVETDLKKYKELNGYTAEAYTTSSFIKHLVWKFGRSEYELRRAHRNNRVRIVLLEYIE